MMTKLAYSGTMRMQPYASWSSVDIIVLPRTSKSKVVEIKKVNDP